MPLEAHLLIVEVGFVKRLRNAHEVVADARLGHSRFSLITQLSRYCWMDLLEKVIVEKALDVLHLSKL